jgi:hypothetical protein
MSADPSEETKISIHLKTCLPHKKLKAKDVSADPAEETNYPQNVSRSQNFSADPTEETNSPN